MNSKELATRLRALLPSINTQSPMPLLHSFHFDEFTVRGYDGSMIVEDANPIALTGSVKAEPLLQWLRVVAGEVGCKKVREGLQFSCGRSHITLPSTDSYKDVPEYTAPDLLFMGVGEDIKKALVCCSQTMGTDLNYPWRLGVTVKFEKDGATWFYSTNNYAVTAVLCQPEDELDAECTVIFPPAFVAFLVKREAQDGLLQLSVRQEDQQEYIDAVFGSGLVATTTTVEGASTVRFTKILERVQEDLDDIGETPIPMNMETALKQLDVVVRGDKDGCAQMECLDGVCTITAQSVVGFAADKLDMPDHADFSVTVVPSTIRSFLKYVDRMCVGEDALLFLSSSGDTQVALSAIAK